jgi:hypothetical protein
MASGPARSSTRPQLRLTARLSGKGRVDPLLHPLPAAGPQQSVDCAEPQAGTERLLTFYDPALPFGKVAAGIRYRCPHVFSLARASSQCDPCFTPCGKPSWPMLAEFSAV